MKAYRELVELLHDEMVRSGYFGPNGRDDEMIAGIVGAVQEWLDQDEVVDVLDFRQHASTVLRDQLRRMAGSGLEINIASAEVRTLEEIVYDDAKTPEERIREARRAGYSVTVTRDGWHVSGAPSIMDYDVRRTVSA